MTARPICGAQHPHQTDRRRLVLCTLAPGHGRSHVGRAQGGSGRVFAWP